jgi:hypothetical protein
MASEIKTITSESLEAAYRALTPSQSGFTQDLMASNTIIPVLDLTADAQGTSTPVELQEAWDYSTTLTICENTTPVTIINSPGFYLINAEATPEFRGLDAATPVMANISMTDGTTPKTLWQIRRSNANDTGYTGRLSNFRVFVPAGYSVTGYTNAATKIMSVFSRQIADVNGNLTNPFQFTPQ